MICKMRWLSIKWLTKEALDMGLYIKQVPSDWIKVGGADQAKGLVEKEGYNTDW